MMGICLFTVIHIYFPDKASGLIGVGVGDTLGLGENVPYGAVATGIPVPVGVGVGLPVGAGEYDGVIVGAGVIEKNGADEAPGTVGATVYPGSAV